VSHYVVSFFAAGFFAAGFFAAVAGFFAGVAFGFSSAFGVAFLAGARFATFWISTSESLLRCPACRR
jgi:hypothetical protein